MAGIYTSVSLTERMTHPLRQINNMVSQLISNMEKCGATADVSFNGESLGDMERQLRETNNAQNDMNNAMNNGASASTGLNSKLAKLAATYFSLRAVINATKLLLSESDEYVLTTARINMMNDGLQTTEQLQRKIYDAAQRSRASYTDLSNVVAQIGNQVQGVFSTNDELVKFSETLNKMFVISGQDSTQIQSTMYNLTQSLSSGALMGQDYRILKMNAPQMVKILQDYYGVNRVELDKMVSAGQVGANDIKNAMLGASQSINSQFEKMPVTWSQTVTKIKNEAFMAFEPVYERVSEMLNGEKFSGFLDRVSPLTTKLADIVLDALENIGTVLGWASDDLDILIPAIEAAVVGWATYELVAHGAETAQKLLNAAMDANPIFLIISAVMALIIAITSLWEECEWFRNGVIDIILDILDFSYKASVKIVELIGDTWDKIRPILRAMGVFLGPGMNSVIMEMDLLVNNKDNLDQIYQEGIDWLNSKRELDTGEAPQFESPYDYEIPDIVSYTGDIADNTSALASASEGTLKYLKDIAEREAVNRFTTAEVKVELGGVSNTINNTTDMDGFVNLLAAKTEEALSITAAKSYS